METLKFINIDVNPNYVNYWIVQWSSQSGNDKPYCWNSLPATFASAPILLKNFDVFQWNLSISIFHFVIVSGMK